MLSRRRLFGRLVQAVEQEDGSLPLQAAREKLRVEVPALVRRLRRQAVRQPLGRMIGGWRAGMILAPAVGDVLFEIGNADVEREAVGWEGFRGQREGGLAIVAAHFKSDAAQESGLARAGVAFDHEARVAQRGFQGDATRVRGGFAGPLAGFVAAMLRGCFADGLSGALPDGFAARSGERNIKIADGEAVGFPGPDLKAADIDPSR